MQIQQEQDFSSWDIYSYSPSLPKEKLSASDPEVFYHGWRIKHLFNCVGDDIFAFQSPL